MKGRILSIFIFGIMSIVVYAQSGSSRLFGVVKDAKTNESLIGAYVLLENTGFVGVSDENGSFLINNIPAGEYSLKVSYIGYDDKVLELQLSQGESLELNLELAYSGVALGAVEVTAQAKGQISAINDQ
ncbi:MAG: TonB-dependent receptor, partial [Ignavibacteriae bacterium]